MAAVTRRQYKGAAASTTITAGINTSDTTCSLAATTGWPSTAAVPFFVVIDPGTSSEEKCSATISGSTLTLTRAQDNTSAATHASGATIYPVFTAAEADEANNMAATMTTKGDLLVTTGSAFNRLAVGTNGFGLIADSASTNGVKWGAPYNTTVSTKTASYTLVAADVGTRVVMNAGATNTTITVNTSLFAAGDTLQISNISTSGTCTVTAGTATVGSSGSLVVPTNGGGTLYFTSASSAIFFNTANIDQTVPTSNRNAIINGNMSTWQRGTSIAYGINAVVYHADRWSSIRVASPSGATISRQTSSLTGIQYCARVQRDVSNASTVVMYFGTSLESSDSYRFAGQTVTLSYYARAGANYSPTSSALIASITTGTGTDQNVFSGFTGATTTSSTATLTTSWQRFTVTATVASNVTQISAYYTMNPVGTAGAADYFEVTGVQLEVGSVATPFEFEDASTTFAKCQRYFETQDWSGNTFHLAVAYATSVLAQGFITYQPKRVAPSFSFSSNGSGRYIYQNGGIAGSQTLTTSATSYNGSSFSTAATHPSSSGWVDTFGTLSISAEL